MENKSCGDCRFLESAKKIGFCEKQGMPLCPSELPSCSKFEQRVVTNGDVIRQGGDKALLAYRSNAACYYCSFRGTESCKSDFSNCKDGQLAWLNAPAESEGCNANS